ncbi:MAG: PAS domain S-box protein [Planctomycetes bacterium]|nr:PAS domain S-box protein [Planctomycetota bacterium]
MPSDKGLSSKVIGQIALMQGVVAHLPHANSIMSFVSRGLRDVPGVNDVQYKLLFSQNQSEATKKEIYYSYLICHNDLCHASLDFDVDKTELFLPYVPYIKNLCNMLAIILEEKRQKELNKDLMEQLEKRVQQRTRDLQDEIRERRLAQSELTRAQNFISNIIDSMPYVLIGVDSAGVVTHWNKRSENMTGLKADKALGRKLGEVLPSMLFDMEQIVSSIHSGRPYRKRKVILGGGAEREHREITIYPLKDFDHNNAVILIEDVTERVKMEEVVIQSDKMMSLGGLAAGMAHEINNPLAGMMQTAGVMADRLKNLEMPANQRVADSLGLSLDLVRQYMEKRDILKMLDRIQESGKRTADIVYSMLSFARKSTESFQSHDLTDLVDKVLALAGSSFSFKNHLSIKDIRLTKEYESHLPQILCDEGKIQQVVLNLIKNGLESMFEYQELCEEKDINYEGPSFTIRISQEKINQFIRLEIHDNGPGMSEETRKRIFEPFYSTKPLGKGMGLGLSISYFIICDHHRGNMRVESSPEQGTKFIIRLPLGDKD